MTAHKVYVEGNVAADLWQSQYWLYVICLCKPTWMKLLKHESLVTVTAVIAENTEQEQMSNNLLRLLPIINSLIIAKRNWYWMMAANAAFTSQLLRSLQGIYSHLQPVTVY